MTEKVELRNRKGKVIGWLTPSLKLGELNRSEKRHKQFSREAKRARRREQMRIKL